MSKNYTVRSINLTQLPQGIDPEEYSGGAWATELNGKIVSVCFEEEMAQAVADNDLASETIVLSRPTWFSLKMDGERIGYCLGSVLPKANKFFGN